MAIEGLKIGMRYKVEVRGMFIADNTAKSYGAECPSITGVGDAHEINCPTYSKRSFTKRQIVPYWYNENYQKNQRFTAKMTFEETTSETLSLKSMYSKQYYVTAGPILRVVQLSPRMKAPIIAEPACANNMAPDYTMAEPRCVLRN